MIMKSNYFFLLPLNPCPLICSFSAFNMMLSMIIVFKFLKIESMLLSLFFLLIPMFLWWVSYYRELAHNGLSSLNLESSLKFSMILFIFSEIFFFFSFFWSYFHYFLGPSMEIGMCWPPLEIVSFNYMNVPLINTLILLSSGFTVTVAHNYLNMLKKMNFFFYLFFTILLGMIFTALQVLEYSTSFFSMGEGSFGCSFFMLTGFHGLHVIIGSVFLLFSLVISNILAAIPPNSLSFELASWYWHFVDVVWIFLYFFLYYINF